MISGKERRDRIIQMLETGGQAISGSKLAEVLEVSRQVIVQDIALLRATNKDIMATSRGYMLFKNTASDYYRSFLVNHADDQIQDELEVIVDNGGKVLDIIVQHEVYGQIQGNLMIENHKEIKEFCDELFQSKDKPLSILSNGDHIHTVGAKSEVILDNIEHALKVNGYLKFSS